MSKLPILEIFGPTIQGEGMVAGQKTVFIRTYGCDYKCSWCDSKFTWDGSQKPVIYTIDKVIESVNNLSLNKSKHVTISGGNPALLKNLKDLVLELKKNGYIVSLETQGSVWNDGFYHIDELTISPKPPSSKMNTDLNSLKEIITKLNKNNINFSFKIVVFDDRDFDFVTRLHSIYDSHIYKWFVQVGNNDVFTANTEELSKKLLNKYDWLCKKIIEEENMFYVRPLPQLHTLIWGNKQGV